MRKKLSILFITFSLLFPDFSPAGGADPDLVTITVPENILRQSIEDTLPLPLNTGQGALEGKLILEAVDSFALEENSASMHGLLVGKNLVLKTRIGKQDFQLKLGEMRLPFTCDFTFRFDPVDKKIFITPHFTDSLQGEPPEKANKFMPVLALFNDREYPVSFENMKKIRTRIGARQLFIEMEPVDIQVMPDKIVLKMLPKVRKTH